MSDELMLAEGEKRTYGVARAAGLGRLLWSRQGRLVLLVGLPLLATLLSLTLGRYGLSLATLWKVLAQQGSPQEQELVWTLIWQVRLPRILAALLVGGALAMSGATYQGLFKNPMVSPDILGASAGAGFGAALAILNGWGFIGIQVSAFAGGLLAVGATYFISVLMGHGKSSILLLVLTGMVISTLFAAFISMTKYVADPYSKLPAITFWLMGGLSSIGMQDVQMLIWPLLMGGGVLWTLRWRLDVLSFGEEEARAMGVETGRLRLIFIVAATLMTAASVAVCGMVGWIGLIIPHLARLVVGPNHGLLLPASLLMGSTFLLLVDNIARCLFSLEIPLGILTAIVGAPCFLYLLLRGGRSWL